MCMGVYVCGKDYGLFLLDTCQRDRDCLSLTGARQDRLFLSGVKFSTKCFEFF